MAQLYIYHRQRLQQNVLLGLCLILFIAASVTCVINYQRHGIGLFTVATASLIPLYAAMAWSIKQFGMQRWNRIAVIFSYIGIILFLTSVGKHSSGLVNWVFTIPVMLYIFFQTRVALVISFAILLYLSFILYQSPTYGLANSFNGLPNFILAYLLIWLLAKLNEAQHVKVKSDMENQALTDELTGSLNRLALRQRANSIEKNKTISLCLVDIDHFKRVNDQFGHNVGDDVLVWFVNQLNSLLPKENIFRLGGEEFVLLFECNQSIATCQMESVLKHINSSPFVLDSSVQKITFSAGLSILGNDLTASLKQADELLYQAKSAGRNQIFSNTSIDS